MWAPSESTLICLPAVSEGLNGTLMTEQPWLEAKRWLLAAVLGLEMTMGIVGNCLVLLVKVTVRCYSRYLYSCL